MKSCIRFFSILLTVFMLTSALSACVQKNTELVTMATVTPIVKEETQQTTTQETAFANVYQNAQYGFSFDLPDSWKDYSVATEEWEGTDMADSASRQGAVTGPIINIRHPLWTAEKPRQDIPIMVFTLAQWTSLQNREFAVGAAPVPPSELGRNTNYVFALPARYNFAFLDGFEEVETILKDNPLKPF